MTAFAMELTPMTIAAAEAEIRRAHRAGNFGRVAQAARDRNRTRPGS